MLARSPEDKSEFFPESSRAKKEYHHKSMRKPHFRTINDAISCALHQAQERRKIGIDDEGVQTGHEGIHGVDANVDRYTSAAGPREVRHVVNLFGFKGCRLLSDSVQDHGWEIRPVRSGE